MKNNDPVKPLVSVGMPLYNSERWVEEAVDSILGQTLEDFELIVADNASTDSSFEICKRLAARDPRIRLYRHDRNIGANHNYGYVLKVATGRYFKWAASSDICAPTFLADCVEVLERSSDVVVATGRTILFSETTVDGELYEHDFDLSLDNAFDRYVTLCESMRLNNVFNGVMRASVIKALPPLGAFVGADQLLMAELALRGKFRLLDNPLYYRRMTRDTSTKLKSEVEMLKHIDPVLKRAPRWQSWHLHLAYLRAVMRSTPLGWAWVRTVIYAIRQMIWARRELSAELIRAMQHTS